MEYCFGVDIGGTTVKMGLFSAEGELIHKWEIKHRRRMREREFFPMWRNLSFERWTKETLRQVRY